VTEEEDQRRHWRLMWLSSIQAFSDSETQRTRWLDPSERNPHFSFVECMCSYFDDAYLGEDDAYEKRLAAGKLSKEEVAAVAEFHAIAERYKSPTGNDWDVQAILQDAEWQTVVDAAKRAQERLLPMLTDSPERDALTQPLDWDERGGIYSADLIGSRIVPAGKWVSEQEGGRFRQMFDGLRRRFGAPNS
jgi:hypothetical protein